MLVLPRFWLDLWKAKNDTRWPSEWKASRIALWQNVPTLAKNNADGMPKGNVGACRRCLRLCKVDPSSTTGCSASKQRERLNEPNARLLIASDYFSLSTYTVFMFFTEEKMFSYIISKSYSNNSFVIVCGMQEKLHSWACNRYPLKNLTLSRQRPLAKKVTAQYHR